MGDRVQVHGGERDEWMDFHPDTPELLHDFFCESFLEGKIEDLYALNGLTERDFPRAAVEGAFMIDTKFATPYWYKHSENLLRDAMVQLTNLGEDHLSELSLVIRRLLDFQLKGLGAVRELEDVIQKQRDEPRYRLFSPADRNILRRWEKARRKDLDIHVYSDTMTGINEFELLIDIEFEFPDPDNPGFELHTGAKLCNSWDNDSFILLEDDEVNNTVPLPVNTPGAEGEKARAANEIPPTTTQPPTNGATGGQPSILPGDTSDIRRGAGAQASGVRRGASSQAQTPTFETLALGGTPTRRRSARFLSKTNEEKGGDETRRVTRSQASSKDDNATSSKDSGGGGSGRGHK